MTEKLKKVQEFVESLESSSDFESCVVLNPSNDDGNTMGGNGTCPGSKNKDTCHNTSFCNESINDGHCTNFEACDTTNGTGCANSQNCNGSNDNHCSNPKVCLGSNSTYCTAGSSGGSNNGNSIGFPGFGFM